MCVCVFLLKCYLRPLTFLHAVKSGHQDWLCEDFDCFHHPLVTFYNIQLIVLVIVTLQQTDELLMLRKTFLFLLINVMLLGVIETRVINSRLCTSFSPGVSERHWDSGTGGDKMCVHSDDGGDGWEGLRPTAHCRLDLPIIAFPTVTTSVAPRCFIQRPPVYTILCMVERTSKVQQRRVRQVETSSLSCPPHIVQKHLNCGWHCVWFFFLLFYCEDQSKVKYYEG